MKHQITIFPLALLPRNLIRTLPAVPPDNKEDASLVIIN